ncbi:MAG: hypothetical protein IPN76_21880 [Saprospiraceae bacterium]|nr:hypothetical protein [Saprospiraceae bacterium]
MAQEVLSRNWQESKIPRLRNAQGGKRQAGIHPQLPGFWDIDTPTGDDEMNSKHPRIAGGERNNGNPSFSFRSILI